MTDDLAAHYPLTPLDTELAERVRRLRELGMGEQPDPDFDAFARRLGEITDAPYAMVNLMGGDRLYFAGLHVAAMMASPGRVLPRDHSFCPRVVARRKALALDDVRDYPRFAGAPVVDEIGVRSYLGAPLIDRTGIALGTVCVVDVKPRRWGRGGLETIKSQATELIRTIHGREEQRR